MRNKWIMWVMAAVLAVGFIGLYRVATAPRVSGGTGGKIEVVASGYVPYILARQIGGDKIDLSMLLPVNAEPHGFEPTPGTIIAVNKADVFIYVSSRIEPWVKDVLSGAGGETAVLESGKPFAAEKDPHVWMSFAQVRQMAVAIEGVLAVKDPQNASYYAANLETFDKEIEELDHAFLTGLAQCQSRTVVHVGHLAFENLTKNYKLDLKALAGTSHDGEHSVKKIADLVKFIKQNDVKTVFTEETLSPRLAQTVSRETGAQLLPLYTIEHVSKDDFKQGVTYADFMKKNLDSLQRGLGCSR